MAIIKPFYCIRPEEHAAHKVAALPYDVYSRKEAKEAASLERLSFLNIDRPETQFDDNIDMYDDFVYEKAKELLDSFRANGIFIKEETECYYIYELIMNGRSQTGVVACASIDDYLNNVIKKHENTREEKERDRIRHVDTCNAQTGPIFLAYRSNEVIRSVVAEKKKAIPLYTFIADDGVKHTVWKIFESEKIEKIRSAFAQIDNIYIADGHHRAASAVKVGINRRTERGFTGEEEYNYFLSVLFPEDELMILPYNRVVYGLNGNTKDEFLSKVSERFEIKQVGIPYAPVKKGCFGMFLDKEWYELCAKPSLLLTEDPVKALDVSILQDYLMAPVLGIDNPRTNKRIDFIGGIRGLSELEKRVNEDMLTAMSVDLAVAFSMYPTSIQELFAVSDAGLLMPPKSTWFEPKLRSGLFIHEIS